MSFDYNMYIRDRTPKCYEYMQNSLERAKEADGDVSSQRTDFRLTVDFPLTYVYIEREKLGKVRAGGPHVDMVKGEGRLIDLSYGGAAFTAPTALEAEGFAQLQFTIHDDPVHMMLEVLDRYRAEDGTWIHRGRFRGMSQDAKNRVYRYLSREQVARLREKEAFHKNPGE